MIRLTTWYSRLLQSVYLEAIAACTAFNLPKHVFMSKQYKRNGFVALKWYNTQLLLSIMCLSVNLKTKSQCRVLFCYNVGPSLTWFFFISHGCFIAQTILSYSTNVLLDSNPSIKDRNWPKQNFTYTGDISKLMYMQIKRT